MVGRKTALKIRKTHRYLGLFIGIQFLFWTISGMYFSWTDINDIHGDQFKNLEYKLPAFNNLISPTKLNISEGIRSIEIRDINTIPYYWINKLQLYNASNGKLKLSITEEEALYVAKQHMKQALKAYVSVNDGKFQTVRHRSWRWFDFLWMTHTMDYDGRDNFNTIVLRVFSLLGLITVLSGFLLWYTSSLSIKKSFKRKRKKYFEK